MNKQEMSRKRKLATTSMAILGVTLVVGGAFAALSDTLSHDESVVIEWVDIVDGSSTNLSLEDVSDVTNTPVVELTPGVTYELTGTLENDSTVVTDWSAIDVSNTPGMTVNIADTDGDNAPVNVGEDVDVSQFGITVQVDQSVTPSTGLNFAIEFNSTDARDSVPTLDEPTAISSVFSDPALATCVANDDELMSITGGDVNYVISQTELNGITNLTCASAGVTNLEGLQYLTNLETLDLNNNAITDLTPIAQLTDLTHLYLYHNEISDITALTNLTNLVLVDLGYNNVSDLSPLSNLKNLEKLFLRSNQITDLTPLAELTNLTYVHLSTNQISDLTPLANLTNLEYLNLEYNQISNLDPLANLENLTYLSLYDNQVSELTPLSNLTNLEELILSMNEIVDITPLMNLTNLTYLSLGSNEITNIDAIANLTNLTSLKLYDNNITDITPIAGLINLEELYLNDNQISDFSALTYQPATFAGQNQEITLPDVIQGLATPINIEGIAGEDLIITFRTPGEYENGQLTWYNSGTGVLDYASADGTISGTITQSVIVNY